MREERTSGVERKVRKIKQRERLEIDIVAVVLDFLIREREVDCVMVFWSQMVL